MIVVELEEKRGQRAYRYVTICAHCKETIENMDTGWGMWAEPVDLISKRCHTPIELFHEECLNDALYARSREREGMYWNGYRIMDMAKELTETYRFDPARCRPPIPIFSGDILSASRQQIEELAKQSLQPMRAEDIMLSKGCFTKKPVKRKQRKATIV